VRPSSPAPALLWESSGPGPGGRYGPCVPGTFDESTPTDACTGRASARVGRSSCTVRTAQTDGLSAPVPHSCSALGESTALHRTRAAAASALSLRGPASHLWHLAETLACSPAAHPAHRTAWWAERDGKGSLPGIGGCGMCLHQHTPANPAQQHTLLPGPALMDGEPSEQHESGDGRLGTIAGQRAWRISKRLRLLVLYLARQGG
jgi:hypothetical protein